MARTGLDLPKAADLRAIFEAARDCGLTKLRIGADGSVDAELGPVTQADLVKAINGNAPLPLDQDPIQIIRDSIVRPTANAEPQDILEAMASGQPIVAPMVTDPTGPQ